MTREDSSLLHSPRLLKQMHGKTVVLFPNQLPDPLEADAAISRTPETLCIVRTADCLPILVTNKKGNEVAAIHAGWKGLVAGIIEEAFIQIESEPQDCMVWIGPAICGNCFEVGPEVREAFINKEAHFAEYFKSGLAPDKFIGNLPQIATSILKALGVSDITQSQICTIEDLRCDSYRRENGSPQRMLTGISFT